MQFIRSLPIQNLFLQCVFVSLLFNACCSKLPNFLFVLTDDQDVSLGGLIPMKKTRSIIGDEGAEFINMFVTTPLCCPSRASILTGKYAHSHGVRNNSISGNCNSAIWQQNQEGKSFITSLKKAGYSTFYAGKYLNQYGDETAGGVAHIPSGWDEWIALVGNSCYYNYSLSVNGRRVLHGSDPNNDYLTNVIVENSLQFLEKQNETVPFFMFLSPPAPHSPFTPFPPFATEFSNSTAPRTPNFGVSGGKIKHWLLRQTPNYLPDSVIKSIDEVFRNRWRTLMSVDDGISLIHSKLLKMGLLDNTYVVVTSDNGFHLGQFSLPWDKRQLYEFDIRVPLLVRGPEIRKGQKIKHPVLNIDLAPTFLELANIPAPWEMDGKSFASLLKNSDKKYSQRSPFIIEHEGESSAGGIPGCPQYLPKEVHTCEVDCICEDSWNNTYTCLRYLTDTENYILCSFDDTENFGEAYNISEDPFQLNNIFPFYKKNNVKMTELKSIIQRN